MDVAANSGVFSRPGVTVQPANLYPDPKPDRALIYFFREHAYANASLSHPIRQGKEVVGVLADGAYYFTEVSPGSHTYIFGQTEIKASITIEAVAGHAYYVKCETDMGFVGPRVHLSLVTKEEATAILPKLAYATMKLRH